MKVLFYTYYMLKGTERLMPWRTLVEVVRWMNATGRHEAAICSAQEPEEARQYQGVTIYNIEPSYRSLRDFVIDGGWQAVYYPVTYRQGLKEMRGLADIPAEIIAYVPGGLSPLSGVVSLICSGHGRLAQPYLLDTVTPHKWLAKRLHNVGIHKIVCQAPLTAQDAVEHGWKREGVYCALPGKDIDIEEDDSLMEQLGLKGQRFLLFSGAPSPVRGAVLALKAFDKVAEKLPGVKLVMLMRRDVSSDFSEMDFAVQAVKHKEHVIVSYERLTRPQLFGMFRAAWAVLLPFLIVPSEIPLTFFEVMSLGTPVITFENGGTTEYLRRGLKIARSRNAGSLGKAMLSICRNEEERKQLSRNAKQLMDNHPTWDKTAAIWEKALVGQNA